MIVNSDDDSIQLTSVRVREQHKKLGKPGLCFPYFGKLTTMGKEHPGKGGVEPFGDTIVATVNISDKARVDLRVCLSDCDKNVSHVVDTGVAGPKPPTVCCNAC